MNPPPPPEAAAATQEPVAQPAPVAGLVLLFFLVLATVGMLRPIRNSFALDGLPDREFYTVYLVSALVVLFVPTYQRLARRVPWRTLIPGLAGLFALCLVAFRLLYREGSPAFGLAFYGWYDLFSAALVTQFFLLAQGFFDARSAKSAYPRVIAGGALGATAGGALTGFLAPHVGTPDLLLVAAGLLVAFAAGVPLLWRRAGEAWAGDAGEGGGRVARDVGPVELFGHPHVRRIAAMVLLTALVKQVVDYEFNVVIGQTFVTRDAVSAFQGKFYAATQWLPLVVLGGLPFLLRRWGVGLVLLLLPALMLVATASLAVFWSLWAAVAAKGIEQVLRYSSERTTREILYVPLPEELKLGAKAYIDLGVEKGLGKAVAAVFIFVLLSLVGPRGMVWVAGGLALVWLLVTVEVRKEYVRSLARSLRGRFATLESPFASIADASSTPIVEDALAEGNPLQTAFVLDLLDRSGAADVERFSAALHGLLEHPSERIRERTLQVLRHAPGGVRPDRVRPRLSDPDEDVRREAVRTLVTATTADRASAVRELLDDPDPRIRAATVDCIVRDGLPEAMEVVRDTYFGDGRERSRLEVAAASATLADGPEAVRRLEPLLTDRDPRVASAAARSAGRLGRPELVPPLVEALARPRTRAAAADALARVGRPAVEPMSEALRDVHVPVTVRRHIPSVLARIPEQVAADALLRSYLAPETDQLLDYRTLKALNKLLAREPGLEIDGSGLRRALRREVRAARRYAHARARLTPTPEPAEDRGGVPAGCSALLARSLREAWGQRRESAFRILGLMFPGGEAMYHGYLATSGRDPRARANALEWLESTVGGELFRRLEPVLDARVPRRTGSRDGGAAGAARSLWEDNDRWIGRCALWAAAELQGRSLLPELRAFRPPDPDLARSARVLASVLQEEDVDAGGETEMDLIQKVFLLQNVDLLREARSSQLALLGSIAEEVDVGRDAVLVRRGEPTRALFVVIRGRVELRGMDDQCLQVSGGSPFGTWALIDQSPSLVEARAVEPTRVLRIERQDFQDLLSDHPELGLDLLQGLARRFRSLAGQA